MLNLIQRKISVKKLFIYLVVLLLPILIFVIYKSNLFSIEEVDCKTQYGPCLQEDIAKVQKHIGKNIFFLSKDKVKEVLSQDTMNRKVVVQKNFPWELKVRIEKRKPIVAITNQQQLLYFLVDRDAIMLEPVEKTFLPTLLVRKKAEYHVGDYLGEDVKNAVQILYLTTKNEVINSTILENKSITFELDQGLLVIFPLSKDPQVLVGALQLILSRSRIEGKLPKVIDLRYIKPVLTY